MIKNVNGSTSRSSRFVLLQHQSPRQTRAMIINKLPHFYALQLPSASVSVTAVKPKLINIPILTAAAALPVQLSRSSQGHGYHQTCSN